LPYKKQQANIYKTYRFSKIPKTLYIKTTSKEYKEVEKRFEANQDPHN